MKFYFETDSNKYYYESDDNTIYKLNQIDNFNVDKTNNLEIIKSVSTKSKNIQRINFNSNNLQLVFILTEECNLRCSYCYACNKVAPDMNIDMLIMTLKKFFKKFKNSSMTVTFFGGEPMLKKILLKN